MISIPAFRRFLAAWLALIAMTLATGLFGQPEAAGRLSLFAIGVLGTASVVKARLILSVYLGLRDAPVWDTAFAWILYGLAALVYVLCIIPGW